MARTPKTPKFQPSGYRLVDHPSDPSKLIVVDTDGNPVSGKTIVVGDAEIQGDATHPSGKGPVVPDENTGQNRRLVVRNGTVESDPVA